jgi:4-hydroxybenzoate polyprenyltransferase
MIRNLLLSTVVLAALAAPTFAATAATTFYVAQDAKSHLCMVSDAKPDGKMAMDAGTKVYATKAAAEQAMAALKACAPVKAAAMAPAPKPAAVAPKAAAPVAAAAAGTFYVEQDMKSHKCMVDSAKPDGKKMIDVGTKAYETKGRAEQAMGMLKVCKG